MTIVLGAARVGTSAAAGLLTGPLGMGPKYFCISVLASATLMSPDSETIALLGPYLSMNQRFTVARLAASRSAIEPMVEWWYGWPSGKRFPTTSYSTRPF